MASPQSLVIGADNHVGAYLARLLAARGERVSVIGDSLLAPLGIVDDVEPVTDVDALRRAGDCSAIYFVEDGGLLGERIFPELLAAMDRAAAKARVINIVDHALIARNAAARARVRDIVVQRSEAGLNAANAVLHAHDSRLGPSDSLPARIIAQFAACKAGAQPAPAHIPDPGPQDWGWTAEYVDAVQRIARLPRPMDVQIATGHPMSAQDMIAHAGEWFGIDPAPLFTTAADCGQAATPDPDIARLRKVTGWSASTWGRDLVRTLAEGRSG